MAYLTCKGDIDFSPVCGLIPTGTLIPMGKGCAIGSYMYLHIHIRYNQTVYLCMVTFISKPALRMANLRIRRSLTPKR